MSAPSRHPTPRPERGGRGRSLPTAIVAAFALVLSLSAGLAPAAAESAPAAEPVDRQMWVDQEDLTWDAYTPVPNQPPGWRNGTITGTRDAYSAAVVLLDYIDQPFLITQEPETHPFGNPQPGWEPIGRPEVNQWMDAYLNTPNQYNGGQSITGYWMEDSHGKISVDITTYGPYMLPGKVHEYGLADFAAVVGPGSQCPLGDVCNKAIRTDGAAAWRAAENNPTVDTGWDNVFFVTAGFDESSTWQEFGEMIFQTQDDVPDAFGPPGAGGATPPLNNAGQPMTNWSPTRYVPWTSWRAAANHWPNASGGTTTQAESSGQSVYAHEFSHVSGLPDNYNNPFANTVRNYTGYWEMMSRGTFNGPGGTHNRWQVPNAGGSGLGPHHMVHFKQDLGIFDPQDQVLLDRNSLLTQGIAVTRLKARSSMPAGDPVALQVTLGTGGYSGSKCASEQSPSSFWCPPGTWQNYTMEVVDRMGNDSFTPGHGVLLAVNRASGTPEEWLIDAHPEDINMIDFYRPDGTPVPVVRGDPRQLNDATFHAGTDSGSEFEYADNNLHFYILDKHRDADGVLYYDLGVRNRTGAGAFVRGVELGAPAVDRPDPSTFRIDVPLRNTGQAGTGMFDSDIYRISSTIEGGGWDVSMPYEVMAVAAGEAVPLRVSATKGEGAAASARVTITATSEADPTKTQTITIDLPPVSPPVLLPDGASLTVDEGQVATNSGTFTSDTPEQDVAITASVGTVTKDGVGSGTWSWSYTPDDGPAESQDVTITGNNGAIGSTSFALSVSNVAPSATLEAPSQVGLGDPIPLSLTSPGDPSAADAAAGFEYAFDCGSGPGAFGAGSEASCTTSSPGVVTVRGAIRDKDGGVTEYEQTVAVGTLREAKTYQRDRLAAITTANAETNKKIAEAVRKLDESLASELWLADGMRLDPHRGYRVFDKEREAVVKLMEIQSPPSGVADVIAALVEIDEHLAGVAVADATAAAAADTGNAAKADAALAEARAEMDLAAEQTDPEQAIDHYKKAWKLAHKSITYSEDHD